MVVSGSNRGLIRDLILMIIVANILMIIVANILITDVVKGGSITLRILTQITDNTLRKFCPQSRFQALCD